jgi:Peptidase family M1 domain
VLGRWKTREAESKMHIAFEDVQLRSTDTACLLHNVDGGPVHQGTICKFEPLGYHEPNFVIANYKLESRSSIDVLYLPGHETSATKYADEAAKLVPFITDWFGAPHEKVRTADLPDPKAAPFENGSLLLTPLVNDDSKLAGLAAAHQLTHAAFASPRPWINEGLAHFAQALYLEHEKNRQAALDYMGVHRAAFVEAEKSLNPSEDAGRSLANTTNEELYRSKAMCVWWMLRDMIGDEALKKALAAYRTENDKEPSYMPRLIAAQTQRDLAWFFDDWIYHDRGLPDFKVESVFPRKTTTETYMVTITIDNLGTASAEVPVIVKSAGADVTKRVEVRAKSKVTIRVETPARPLEVVVNDSGVPESDMSNNVFKVASDE